MFLLLCCRGICWMQGWWPWQSFHPLTFWCCWGWWLRSLLLLLILTWWWSVWWLTFSWRRHAQSAWLSLSLFKEALCAKPDNNMNHVVKKVLLFLLGCCRKRIILFSTILASNHWGQHLFSMQGTLRVLLTTNHRSQASLVSWWVLSQLKNDSWMRAKIWWGADLWRCQWAISKFLIAQTSAGSWSTLCFVQSDGEDFVLLSKS